MDESLNISGTGRAADCPPADIAGLILSEFKGNRQDIRTFSPLTLAYIGDAVYELIVRTAVVEKGNRPAGRLHNMSTSYVNAKAQARIAESLEYRLTDAEQAVYRRGRNSRPHTMAKNADASDYLKATGFEAVLGYLYLEGRTDRVLELVREGISLAGLTL